MKRLIAVLAMAVWASAAAGAATDGNQLLESCQSAMRAFDGDVSQLNPLDAGQCIGITEGVRNTLIYLRSTLPKDYRVCFPETGINDGQGIRIVLKYLENNPEKLHLEQTLLTMMAYKTAYPCN